MEGKKFDQGKPELDLLPPSYWTQGSLSFYMAAWFFVGAPGAFRAAKPAYDPMGVLAFGKKKYAAHNWYKGMRWGRLVASFHRHCNSYDDKSKRWLPRDLDQPDEESGLAHGAHAACCWLFLREYVRVGVGENDSPNFHLKDPPPFLEAVPTEWKDAVGHAYYHTTTAIKEEVSPWTALDRIKEFLGPLCAQEAEVTDEQRERLQTL